MVIELRNAGCIYPGSIQAVSDLSLEILEGETLILIGTSGCGKSTTLKMINGLVRPTSGQVFLTGSPLDYDAIYAARLKMGYVIQSAGLFPHMTVGENISIMARMLRWKKEEVEKRVSELLNLVGLDEERFVGQYPLALSGGEQQRVGVARALMLDPPVLLMDEPFGALDVITRHQLQKDFLQLKKGLKKTVVLVTHDLEEAFKLADRIAIMNQGRLQQCDTPEAIRRNPANAFVEQFLRL